MEGTRAHLLPPTSSHFQSSRYPQSVAFSAKIQQLSHMRQPCDNQPTVATNDVSKSRDVSRRRARISQHERVITSGVDDVIISGYQVDVTSSNVDAHPGVAIPREIRHLLQVGYIVGGLKVTGNLAGNLAGNLQVNRWVVSRLRSLCRFSANTFGDRSTRGP